MEPLSKVHRTSTDFDTQARGNKQGTDGATDGDDRLDVQEKKKSSMQSGKRPMEPLSEVHRTSTDFDLQASKETDKGPMEPPMEMTDLTCKKCNKKRIQTGKRPMEPLSKVHRTSIDFDTRAKGNRQGTDGATDGDDRLDVRPPVATSRAGQP